MAQKYIINPLAVNIANEANNYGLALSFANCTDAVERIEVLENHFNEDYRKLRFETGIGELVVIPAELKQHPIFEPILIDGSQTGTTIKGIDFMYNVFTKAFAVLITNHRCKSNAELSQRLQHTFEFLNICTGFKLKERFEHNFLGFIYGDFWANECSDENTFFIEAILNGNDKTCVALASTIANSAISRISRVCDSVSIPYPISE